MGRTPASIGVHEDTYVPFLGESAMAPTRSAGPLAIPCSVVAEGLVIRQYPLVRIVAGMALFLVVAMACSGGPSGESSSRVRTAEPCSPPSERDPRTNIVNADLDGDGHADVSWRRHRQYEVVVGACIRGRSFTELLVSGMGEGIFEAVDIDNDGRAELLQGGTTASQHISEVIVVKDGRLQVAPGVRIVDGP